MSSPRDLPLAETLCEVPSTHLDTPVSLVSPAHQNPWAHGFVPPGEPRCVGALLSGNGRRAFPPAPTLNWEGTHIPRRLGVPLFAEKRLSSSRWCTLVSQNWDPCLQNTLKRKAKGRHISPGSASWEFMLVFLKLLWKWSFLLLNGIYQ